MTATTRRRGSDPLSGEIISAATEFLAQRDAATVSIRDLADRVGVTAPAIYRRFRNKEALLDAVAAAHFERLSEQLNRMTAAGDSRPAPLDELCSAYLRFAMSAPRLYQLATMRIRDTASATDEVLRSGVASAFARALAAEADMDADSSRAAASELWMFVHGVTSLVVAKPYLNWGRRVENAERAIRSALLVYRAGEHPPIRDTTASARAPSPTPAPPGSTPGT